MLANKGRVQKDLEYCADCSDRKDLPGTTRVAFSPSLRKACDYIADQMVQAGLTVRIDEIGNVIGRLEGTDPDAKIIMTGSHMDTVVSGGNFDGIAGVVAGVEAARLMKENGIKLKSPVEVVGFVSEENSRFFDGLIGSRGMFGQLSMDEVRSATGPDGKTMYEAIREWGLDPEKIPNATREKGSLKKYVELHIEQNFLLEQAGKDIGVVKSISGSAHYVITVHGSADHAGGTPMNIRKDAMLACAEVILDIEKYATAEGDDTVATVGKLDVSPGFPNIIPDHVDFVVDVRSSKMEHVCSVMNQIHDKLEEVCNKRGCTFDGEQLYHNHPVPVLEEDMVHMERICEEKGFSYQRIFSGAGHDAISAYEYCPVCMIFIPCRGGRSHCPEEWSDYNYVAQGAEVLYEMLRVIDRE